MKNLFVTLIALLGFTLTSYSQEVAKKSTKSTKVVSKTEVKTVMKKDGTPDKRYSKKVETKVVLKKDGTPDKRYTK
ncbi:MAG: hypothetical protein H7239_01835 [Flavobacterium sp.]|nr:hypothetical protein [Flavobacterium sp.]